MKIALADGKARVGDPDRALAILDEALATAERTDHRAIEAELHRTRGEILLQRDAATCGRNLPEGHRGREAHAPAWVASPLACSGGPTNRSRPPIVRVYPSRRMLQQATLSFQLRAALALAKL